MSKPWSRTILSLLAALVLLAALPALAAPAPPAVITGSAPTAACHADIASPFTTAVPAAAVPAAPEWLVGRTKFHGFCRCGCSTIPNCNTNADCGGGVCSSTISCC